MTKIMRSQFQGAEISYSIGWLGTAGKMGTEFGHPDEAQSRAEVIWASASYVPSKGHLAATVCSGCVGGL